MLSIFGPRPDIVSLSRCLRVLSRLRALSAAKSMSGL